MEVKDGQIVFNTLFFSKVYYRMKLRNIERTPNNKKAFVATFIKPNGKEKIQRFGTTSNYVLNPSKTEQDKKAYIARHKMRENFNDPMSAGSLSKHILWGDSRVISKNIKDFKKKFNV
jgi:hypothetical protein